MIRFLDPAMLLFCMAAVVPPIVAWLGRRGEAIREWGAMEILARAAGRTAFRRRCVDWLLEWLVVAMRCAMLLAVAFAAARPLFEPADENSGPAGNEAAARERRAIVVGEATAVVAAIESAAPAFAPVRSIEASRLDEESFESASLVVLADGVVPSAAAAGRLRRFVGKGGGVAVLLGPRTTKREAVVDPPTRQTIRLTATAEGEPETGLAGPTVGRMARLVARQSIHGVVPDVIPDAIRDVVALPHGPPVVLARAEPSEEPLAVRLDTGTGAVGIVAVPLAIEGWSGGGWAVNLPPASAAYADWSDLPAWPAFLPFVERTILPLAAARGVAAGSRGPERFGAGVAEWLAGRNLAGAALVLALLLVLLDPLVSRLVRPSSRLRGLSPAAVAARVLAIAMLVVMLWNAIAPPKVLFDGATEPFTPSLAVRTPRIVRLGDAVGIDVDAVLASDGSRGPRATGDLVDPLLVDLFDATGAMVASAPLVERDFAARDDRTRRPRRPLRVRGRIVWRPEAAGTFSGSVRVRGDEAVSPAPVSLRVADEPLRIFLLDRYRFESRFLSRLLARDDRFAVTERLQGADAPPPGAVVAGGDALELPATREAWNRFDVVVIGGVDPLAIPEPAAALVEAAANDGVGIVWSLDAGSDPEAIAVSPLGRLLPFRGVSRHRPFTTGFRIELANSGEESAWLTVADDAAASREAWRTLPSVYAPVRPFAVRPTARGMATIAAEPAVAGESGPASPFILVDQAGKARVVAFLAETWRLRQGARGPLVDRLLSQAMVHAAEPHFASRLRETTSPGPETNPDDEAVVAAEGPRGGMPKSDLPISPPSAARPLWNHPAILLALIAACGVEWWIRERSGEGP